MSVEDVNLIERLWERYHELDELGQMPAAVEMLRQIEQVSYERKSWPDLAAALWMRHSLEYALTHKDDFFKELLTGSLAERMEAFPAEVRPALRLLLVHDGLTMKYPRQWWKKIPKRPLFADEPPPWSVWRIVSTLASQFDLIAADREFLLVQKVEDWSRLLFVGDSFTRMCRPTLWDFAVYDIVDFAGRMKKDDEILRSKALGWLDGLLLVHPLDAEPDAHLHARYRKLLLEGGDKLTFAEKWFATSAVSADAAHAAAADLAKSEKGEDRVRAHAIAERFYAKWPDSPGGCDCLRLLRSLEEPSLSLRIENQLLACGETISVTARNLTGLSFRLVPVASDRIPAIRREMDDRMWHRPQKADDELPKLVNEEAVAEWSVWLDEWHDYIDHDVECAIPVDIPLGYYVLFAATNDKFGADGLPSWCRIVSRTDLHLICRKGPTHLSGYVSDAETGRPCAGVGVEFNEESYRTLGFSGTARSAADGSWAIRLPLNLLRGSVRARAVVPVKAENLSLLLRMADKCGLVSVRSTAEQGTVKGWVNARLSGAPVVRTVRLHLLTDRETYRPGEVVKFKGYAYFVNDQTQGYAAVAHRRVSVEFHEEQRALGDKLKLRTNEFGTFSGEFALSEDGPTGRYVIEVSLAYGKCDYGARADYSVKVERSKAPLFSSVPKGHLAAVASGGARMPKAMDSGNVLPWKLELKSPCDTWRTASVPTAWRLTLRTSDNRPVAGVEVEVKVYALRQPEQPLRKGLGEVKWMQECEGKSLCDLTDPRNWEVGGAVATMLVITTERGEAAGSVALGAGVYRLEGTVKTERGKIVRASEFIRVIDPSAQTYSTREAAFSCVEKTTVRVGEAVRLFFGTGYASAFCHVRVIRGDEVLVEEIREGTNWVFEFPVTEKHRGTLHFERTFVRENRVYHEDHPVMVPWEELGLEIVREQMNCKLLPNTRETWRFRIVGAGTNDIRPGVEVLAYMYDTSVRRKKTPDESLDEQKTSPLVLPFCDLLPEHNGYGPYEYSNGSNIFCTWSGKWPDLPNDSSELWPDWRTELLGVFKDDPDGRGPCWIRRGGKAGEDAWSRADESSRHAHENGWSRGDRSSRHLHFDGTAFFLPSLISDANGQVEFSFTVPPVIANWRFVLLAHDCNLAHGIIDEKGIVTVRQARIHR